jgi:hypothetical protein
MKRQQKRAEPATCREREIFYQFQSLKRRKEACGDLKENISRGIETEGKCFHQMRQSSSFLKRGEMEREEIDRRTSSS